MKKTAIALAAILAASSSAIAAEVTVYGKVDMGVAYNNADTLSAGTAETFSMDSGNNSGSRFGLKGSEDLGNGYKVVFQLENGFSADTGALGQNGRLFGREARLGLITPMGGFHFGRMGAMTAGAGTFDLFQSIGDAIDGGWSYNFGLGDWVSRDRYDNMITYASPELAGFQFYGQYSFGTDGVKGFNDTVENARDTQRYAGLGATYVNGPLSAGLFLDTVLYKHAGANPDDAQTVSLAFSYDFEVAKLFLSAQYGENEEVNFFTVDSKVTDEVADGWRLHVGTQVPLPCGKLKAGVWYGNVDNQGFKAENFNVAIGHEYPFSKRTYSYVGVAYKNATAERDGVKIDEENSFSTQIGLVHSF